MPKKVYFPTLEAPRNTSDGIDITWTPSTGMLTIGGWYDGCVGIEPTHISLGLFLGLLGITAKDCEKCFVPKKSKTRKETREAK